MSGKIVRIAIAGVGSRGKNAYGLELLNMKDRAKVVAVADIDPERLALAGDAHGFYFDPCPPQKVHRGNGLNFFKAGAQ